MNFIIIYIILKKKDNIFSEILDEFLIDKGGLKPLFIFDNMSWGNSVLLLKLSNISVSGGVIGKRHLLSTNHFYLFSYLFLY